MNLLKSLFVAKVFKDNHGITYYYDPVTKNAYRLSGNAEKMAGLLPIRVAVALFAFLVFASLSFSYKFNINGIRFDGSLISFVISIVGLFVFEIILRKKILPEAKGILPNYQFPPQEEISRAKRITLLICYILLLIAAAGYIYNEYQNIPTLIAVGLLAIFAFVRSIDLINKKR